MSQISPFHIIEFLLIFYTFATPNNFGVPLYDNTFLQLFHTPEHLQSHSQLQCYPYFVCSYNWHIIQHMHCDTPLMRYINCCVFWRRGDTQRGSLWQSDQFYWHFGLNTFMPKHVAVDMCHKWCATMYIWWHLVLTSYIFKFMCSVYLNATSYFDSLVIDIYPNGVSPTTWLNCSISLFGSFKRETCVRNEQG
jgi:hypothetical protein